MINQKETSSHYTRAIEESHSIEKRFKLGSIVALKSHPYQTNYSEPKVGAYANFTPPLMIVIEILKKTTHNTLTGKKDSNQYKCIFYSTKDGKFEKLWFKGEELKYIGNSVEEEKFKVKAPSLSEMKTNLIGEEVVLQTVDLELGKKKTFLDTVDGRSKMKVSNLLDYLPPVASILDIKYEDDHIKYNEKNGKVTSKKYGLQAKIKWLNNESGKFSEETVPLDCLKLVKFNEASVFYKENRTYLLPLKDLKRLEDNVELYMRSIPVLLTSTTFNHYYYVYEGTNVFTKKSRAYSRTFPATSYVDLNKLLESGKDLGDKSDIQKYLSEENKGGVNGKWFKISYIDSNSVYTERIVYVQDFLHKSEANPENESKPTLKCNCLLRGGRLRHFVVERIQKCIALPEEFGEIFFERL